MPSLIAVVIVLLLACTIRPMHAHAQPQEARALWIVNTDQVVISWKSTQGATDACIRRAPYGTQPTVEESIFIGCVSTPTAGATYSITLPEYDPCPMNIQLECIDHTTVPANGDRFIIQEYEHNKILNFVHFGIANYRYITVLPLIYY